jgi:hypothetical protein
MRPFLLLGLAALARAQAGLDYSILASRAQSFAESLPNLVCTEVLRQREIRYESRLKIRPDDRVLTAPPPKMIEREIVSDLGYALDGGANPVWREVRKVIRVDQRNVTPKEKARERLLFGLKSNRDRDRHRMLEEFRKHGLEITVTDYGLVLLLFLSTELRNFEFQAEKQEFIGADRMDVYRFRRKDREVTVNVYDEKKISRAPLEGRLWVRHADSMPRRIQLLASTKDEGVPILDDGTVDYEPSRFGPLVVTGVRFVRFVNGRPIAEAVYQYSNHQRFNAEAELKFDADPAESETKKP